MRNLPILAVRFGKTTSPMVALLHAKLGETHAAFRWLERALEGHKRDLIFLNVYPKYDLFRSDPRFARSLSRFGFPAGKGA